MSNATETLHIRVSREVKRKMEAMAARNGRTVSDYCREVLADETRNKGVMEMLDRIAKLLEFNTKMSIDGAIAIKTFVRVTNDPKMNDPKKSAEENLGDAIINDRVQVFWRGIDKYLGGVSMNYDREEDFAKVMRNRKEDSHV